MGEPNGGESTRELSAGSDRQVLRFSTLKQGARFAERYEILERLGAGGSGEVFAARDVLGGGEVALKVLFPRGDDPQPLARLQRELGAARELRHPGIVRMLHLGEHEGLFYLVLERLHGETLASRLTRRGAFPPDEAVAMVTEILEALAAAHAAGVVHRDVKPSNVFLAEQADGSERVVLLDFGLARVAGDTTLTATGLVVGTPEYVSPEQARGETELTPASDVYSAGVLLWEILAGSPPFRGDSAVQILVQHDTGELPALPPAPRRVRRALGWALAKKASERPVDAEHLLGVIRGHRRVPHELFLRVLFRRRRLVAAGLALAAGAIGALTPTQVVLDDWHMLVRSPIGVPLGRAEPSLVVRDLLPLGRGKRLGLLANGGENCRPFPEGIPHGLFLIDPWTRRARGLELNPYAGFDAGGRLEHGVEDYDNVYIGRALRALPREGHETEQCYAAVFNHAGHYPALVLFFDSGGTVYGRMRHPGHLSFMADLEPTPREDAFVLFAGVNNELSSRSVVAGVRSGNLRGRLDVPPFGHEERNGAGSVAYYLLSSLQGGADLLVTDDGQARLRGFTTLRFDPRSGVPSQTRSRGGLSEAGWIEERDSFFGLLRRAALGGVRNRKARARELAAWTDDARYVPHRGAGLMRAAELLQEGGELEEALAHARAAASLETRVLEHHCRILDLLFRLRGFDALREEFIEDIPPWLQGTMIDRGLVFAAAQSRHHAADRERLHARLREQRRLTGVRSVYNFESKVLALHAADLEECRAAWERSTSPELKPEYSFLEALALLLDPGAALERAHTLVASHPRGHGGGAAVPLAALREYLALHGHGEAPSATELGAARKAAEESAKLRLDSRYWLAWERGLRAASARARGDAAEFERLRDEASRSPGAGPWLDALLEAR